MKDYVSISEASRLLNVSRPTVYKFIEDGKLRAEKRAVVGTVRIPRADIDRLAAELGYKPLKP